MTRTRFCSSLIEYGRNGFDEVNIVTQDHVFYFKFNEDNLCMKDDHIVFDGGEFKGMKIPYSEIIDVIGCV